MSDLPWRLVLEAAVHAAALAYLPVALLRTRKRPGYLGCALARAGFGEPPACRPEHAPAVEGAGPLLVVHSCSVGETLAILPFVERLRDAVPGCRILHTVTTDTGFDLARKRSTADRAEYLPLDVRPAVRRFLDRHRPALFIAVETELWPVLFFALARRGVPAALVNGRLSDRSFPRYRRFLPFTRALLSRVSLLLMQSAEDAGRVLALGADPRRVLVPGNVKYDALASILDDPAPRHDFRFGPGEPLFVFGSIHPGEEGACLAMMRALRAGLPACRFLLAPRKLDRLDGTLAALADAGFSIERWSLSRGSPAPPPDLLVLDTVGELVDAYRRSVAAFVGGSFVDTGGHNLLEVSACGKPVFFGPHMQNFREIAALAESAGFGERFASPEAAADRLARLSRDPAPLAAMGERARRELERRVGASRRSARAVATLLPSPGKEEP